MAEYAVEINGVNKDLVVQLNPFTIAMVANGVDVGTIDVLSEDGSYVPSLEDDVKVIEIDGSSPSPKILGGRITALRLSSKEGHIGSGIEHKLSKITVHSYEVFAKRRLVTETFASVTLKSFATTIRTNYLATYGVTLDPAQADGPTLPAMTFTDRPLTDVLNEVAEITANFGNPFTWAISPDKVFGYYEVGTIPAPFDIDETVSPVKYTGDIEVEPTREDFATTIVLRVGPSGVQTVTESFTGDGSTFSFPLSYTVATGAIGGYATRGVVVLDGGTQELDIGGAPRWSITLSGGQYFLTQNFSVAPSNGSTLTIEYDAQFPFTVRASVSGAEVSERLYEVSQLLTKAAAEDLAESLLAKHTEVLNKVTFYTRETGLRPSQTIEIHSPKRNLSHVECLISEVNASNEPGRQGIWFRVTAVEGSKFRGSFRELYLDWLGGPANAASGGSSIVQVGGGGTGSGYPIYMGIPHPQGFQAAPLGSLYLRTDGRMYSKLGGSSTSYGWYPISSFLHNQLYGIWASANSSGGAVGSIGHGTALTGAMGTVAASTRGFWNNVARLTTSATINSNANSRPSGGGLSSVNVGLEFDLVAVVILSSDLTTQRIWVGLDEGGGAFNNGDTPGAGIARYAFRYSSVAGDTGWRGQVSDGTTTNTTSAIKSVAADTRYVLRIRGDRSVGSPAGLNPTLYFSVDDEPEVTLSGVPSSDEQMELGLSIYNTAAGARSFDYEFIQVMTGLGVMR